MINRSISIRKAVLIIVVAWILSLVTTLIVVNTSPNIIKDGTVTTNKIVDSAVTNLKLGSRVIPFNTTYSAEQIAKTTASWENITGMSVIITLERNSTLLIMFNTQANIQGENNTIAWQALVNTHIASPGSPFIQPSGAETMWSGISCNFYKSKVSPGKYAVYMQWLVTGGTGYVGDRSLIVIAMPE